MQSFFESRLAGRGATLDTDQPSIRFIQTLIRRKVPVTVVLNGGQAVDGVIRWQDLHFLALEVDGGEPLVLVNREAMVLLRERG